MRMRGWSSDVCASDLNLGGFRARVSFPLAQGVGIDSDCQLAVPSMSATGRRAKAGACRLSAERDGPGTVGGNRDAVALLAAQLQPARPVPLGAAGSRWLVGPFVRRLDREEADRKSTRLHSSTYCAYRMPSSARKKQKKN